MAKLRSDDEQKAVETAVGALGHRLLRMKEEYEMKALRGEEPEGIAKGLSMALRELNDFLPRRKRVKAPASPDAGHRERRGR